MNPSTHPRSPRPAAILSLLLALSGPLPTVHGQTLAESFEGLSPINGQADYGLALAARDGVYMIGTQHMISSNPILEGGTAWIHDSQTDELLHLLSNGGIVALDSMGNSVALTEGFAAVGAFEDTVLGTASGSALVFDADDGELLARLVAQDGAPGDIFGWSVSVSGTTLAVGAILDDDQGDASGSVYLFDLVSMQQVAKLLPSGGQPQSFFGWSMALDGDRLVVGAPGARNDRGVNTGAAYVFDRATGQQLLELIPSDGGQNDRYGTAVAIEGDRILVGGLESDLSDPGAVYVHDATSGEELRRLVPPVPETGQQFGCSVSLSGGRALVGARTSSQFRYLGGTAYLFDVESGDFLIQLWPSDVAAEAFFGTAVALDGDVAVVGAPDEITVGIAPAGAVLRFDLGQLDAPGVPLCAGVGCPCGNDDPSAGCATSLGSGVALASQGSASLAQDDLRLSLEGGPAGQPGLVFMGRDPLSLPFGDGLRCVGGAQLCRFPISAFDAQGRLELGPGLVDLSGDLAPACAIEAGDTWYFQGWFRDPSGPCGNGYNLSQAREIRFSP